MSTKSKIARASYEQAIQAILTVDTCKSHEFWDPGNLLTSYQKAIEERSRLENELENVSKVCKARFREYALAMTREHGMFILSEYYDDNDNILTDDEYESGNDIQLNQDMIARVGHLIIPRNIKAENGQRYAKERAHIDLTHGDRLLGSRTMIQEAIERFLIDKKYEEIASYPHHMKDEVYVVEIPIYVMLPLGKFDVQ